jgi:hypothetical protein
VHASLFFANGMKRLLSIIKSPRFVWVVFFAAAIGVSLRNLFLPNGDLFGTGGNYTHYNNFVIFRNAFFHLLSQQNLYASYPDIQYDVFKYTPTFALLFAPFAVLPEMPALILWNVMGAFLIVFSINSLSALNQNQKVGFALLLLQEFITSSINSQTNVIIAALLLLSLSALEKENSWMAALFIWLTAFIKIFGVLFFALFLLFPQKKKLVWHAVLSGVLLFLLPLPFGGFSGLVQHYSDYFELLSHDHGEFVKYSVMGWLKAWFSFGPNKNAVVFCGLVVQFLILLRAKNLKHKNGRALLASSLLLWMVIFNHMAESATFIIAVTGVLLWYYSQPERQIWHVVILLPVMLFTCLGPSDIYPKFLRTLIVEDWQLKVFPCIVVWIACVVQLYKLAIQKQEFQQ